uniref:prolipoprotein diacylglyceryl transferase family protein n=1 Tax=Dialister invisus TaxID=218538 RepID=UPI003AB4E215
MKQENSQPVKQHKKMNGFADRKLLAGLVFAVGDYMALTLSACLALHLRNIVMTYNIYHINLSYIFFWIPLVFMPFILYSGLYTKRMLTYKITEKLFYASLYGTVFSIIGARLYYVIFEWDNYKNDLLQIFNLRAGGLAIYGGVIGAVLTLL